MIILVGPHHSFTIYTYVVLFLVLFYFLKFFPQLVDEEGDEILILIWIWFIVQMRALTLWKKVMIQNTKQLELVREEIRVSSLFSHPNLLPLLGDAIFSVKVISQSGYSHLIYNCYSYIFLNIKLDTYRIVTWLLLWLDYFSIKLMVSNHSFGFDFGH